MSDFTPAAAAPVAVAPLSERRVVTFAHLLPRAMAVVIRLIVYCDSFERVKEGQDFILEQYLSGCKQVLAIPCSTQYSLLCKPFLHRHADAALLHVGDVSVPLGVPELVVLERLQSFEPIGQQLIS